MKKTRRAAGFILAASLLAGATGNAAETNRAASLAPGGTAIGAAAAMPALSDRRDPALVKKQFDAVAAHLDQGGDLLVIANVDGIVEKAAEWLRAIVGIATAGETNAASVRAAADKLPGFLRKNGFYSIQGVGLSAVPRADGLNEIKTYVSREPASANLPMWRICVGSRPRRMACLDMIPADAAMFRAMLTEPATLWTLVKQGVAEVGGPEAVKGFDKAMAGFAKTAGAPMDTVVGSLGDEFFFAVLVPRNAAAPAGRGAAPAMPWGDASLLAGVAVKNDTLFNLISNKMTQAGQAVTVTNIGAAVVLKSGAQGGPLPISPCVAKFNGYLIVGLDEKAIKDAVGAMERKNGVTTTAEFKKAFADRPMVNSGMAYSTPRFSQKILEIQGQAMSAAGGRPMPQFAALQKVLIGESGQMAAMVTTVAPEGVLTSGISTMAGRDMATAMAAAPAGLLAAIAIPSFVKARSTSQSHACINNLRIMDAAKEQWAMAEKKESGDEPDVEGVCQYIGGARLPVCPAGGQYSLNPIGVAPTCSHPGHVLP